MSHFKTISSISPQDNDVLLEYLKKHYPIPKDIPQITTKHSFDNNPNANLDDIIEAVEDKYKLKNFTHQIPDDVDLLGDQGLKEENRNFITRWLWKIFDIQPKYDTDKSLRKAIGYRKMFVMGTWMLGRWIAFQLMNIFAERHLQKIYVNKLDKHFHNGALVNWLDKQIQSVYDSNQNYQPLPIEQFKKTSIWNRNAAEWRDKTSKQKIRRLTKRSLTIILFILIGKIPSVYSSLFGIPARLVLAYLGVRLAVGSINKMVVSHNGNSVIIGLSYTRYGFELNNLELFVRRKDDRKIVRVELPDPPRQLYLPTKKDLSRFLKENKSEDQIKKELAVVHDRG